MSLISERSIKHENIKTTFYNADGSYTVISYEDGKETGRVDYDKDGNPIA